MRDGVITPEFAAAVLAVDLETPVFSAPDQFSVAGHWAGLAGYAIQVYCDFAGYSLLAGSKLIDITALFSWDHWLSPAPEHGSAQVDWQAYRIAFGASLCFQAL